MRSKVALVAHREFMENVRTKAFWIGILLFPVILGLFMVAPRLLEKTKSAKRYAVVDQSGWLLEAVEDRATMPDLTKVFRTVLELRRDDDPAFHELPDALRQTAIQLASGADMVAQSGALTAQVPLEEGETVEDKLIEGFASVITGLAGPEGQQLRELMPDEAVDALLEVRDAVRAWWQSLPPEEADAFGSGIVTKDRYVRVPVDDLGLSGDDLIAELNRRVEDEELFAYIVIGPDPVTGDEGGKYVSNNLTDDDLRDWFSDLASDVVRERRMAQEDIDPKLAQWLADPLRLAVKKIAKDGEEETVGVEDKVRQWAPVAFVYLLWVAVFTVAQMLLTNTVEEKSNRIMEVLLSSVSPLQLMVGKIAGIAATGLAVVMSWMLFFYLLVRFLPGLLGIELGFNLGFIASDPWYLTSFVVYFLLGYLFYAAFLVGIGAVCNSLKEAQNLMAPVSILLMIPMVLMIPVGQEPNGLLARITSYIPTFTPFVMMNRAAGPPSPMEYFLTTVLMLVSIAVAMWAAAKVFRVGILMTGKAPTPREMIRWIRAPVGQVPERTE